MDPEHGTLVEVKCKCGTPCYYFQGQGNCHTWHGKCSLCVEQARLDGKLWHSTTGEVATYYSLKKVCGELLELLALRWMSDGGYRKVLAYFRFYDEPLLPVGYLATSSAAVMRALDKAKPGVVFGIEEAGRGYRVFSTTD